MILLLRIVLELILNLDRYFHLVRDIKSEARLVIMTLVEGSRDWRNLAGLCSFDNVKLFMERLTGRRLASDSGTGPKTHTGSVLVGTCTRSRAGENTAITRCMCIWTWEYAPGVWRSAAFRDCLRRCDQPCNCPYPKLLDDRRSTKVRYFLFFFFPFWNISKITKSLFLYYYNTNIFYFKFHCLVVFKFYY